jgi:hypothetical protein
MATLEGTVSIGGMPPHRGALVDLAFFRVAAADADPPYGGEPPAEACGDAVEVCAEGLADADGRETTREWPFEATRTPGYYYVQLRVVLYREHRGNMYAQSEQFFFRRRPVHVPEEGLAGITFPVVWPPEPIDELHQYGTVHPERPRPWWRFW